MFFKDRIDAGRQLARALSHYRGKKAIVYALPRGGVVLGVEIARYLKASLDLVIVRKIGHPQSVEYGLGMVAEDGHTLFNEEEIERVDTNWLKKQVQGKHQEAVERRRKYLPDQHPLSAKGKIAILVDDGIATGLSFELAIRELKHQQPKQVVGAIPVAPAEVADELRSLVDELIVLHADENYLGAVGAYYEEFGQVSDEQVIELLREFRRFNHC